MTFQILSLSGGGYMGLYTIAVLSELEDQIGRPLAGCFDLIAGTSVGGIIALGLAAEHPASNINDAFEEMGKAVFRSAVDERRSKTKNKHRHEVMVPATKEHPAQVNQWNEDLPIGTFITTRWTGTISPAKKAEMMDRIDTLLKAVKKARSRANRTEVVKLPVGKKIFDFINEGSF